MNRQQKIYAKIVIAVFLPLQGKYIKFTLFVNNKWNISYTEKYHDKKTLRVKGILLNEKSRGEGVNLTKPIL